MLPQKTMPALVDFSSTEYHNTLYSRYAELRENHPVYFDESRGCWMITRYEDVRGLLRNPAGTKNGETSHSYVPTLSASDGDFHKNVRRHVMPKFTQAVVSELAPVVETIVEQLFAELPDSGEIDIYHQVIKQLPQRFTTQFLGVRQDLAERWHTLGEPLMGIDPLTPSDRNPGPAEMVSFLDEMREVMQLALQDKRENPGNDFLSWLVQQQAEGEMNEEEVSVFTNNLGLASLDTTINLLGNGTGLLARFPKQRSKLIENPDLMDGAIEEMLRMEAPAQALPRKLTEDKTMHGVTMKKGDELSLVFAAANHDPNKYANPEQFDIKRKNHDHLAFGFGLHKCVGQHLARMEARIYFKHLLKRYPDYELGESRWFLSHWARGYAELTIKQ